MRPGNERQEGPVTVSDVIAVTGKGGGEVPNLPWMGREDERRMPTCRLSAQSGRVCEKAQEGAAGRDVDAGSFEPAWKPEFALESRVSSKRALGSCFFTGLWNTIFS